MTNEDKDLEFAERLSSIIIRDREDLLQLAKDMQDAGYGTIRVMAIAMLARVRHSALVQGLDYVRQVVEDSDDENGDA